MSTLREVGDALMKFHGELRLVRTPVAPDRYVASRDAREIPLGGDLNAEVAPRAIRAMCDRLVVPKSLFHAALRGEDISDAWAQYLMRQGLTMLEDGAEN